MQRPGRAILPSRCGRRHAALVAVCTALAMCAWGDPAAAQTPSSSAAAADPGSATRGEALFMGGLRFSNAGPACGSCHDASGARFPAGGTLGPDLTNSYVRFGPAAMQLFLDTLYFPTMAPVFNDHPLTPGEKADLAAFLQHAPNHTRARPPWAIPALALGGFCVLILLTALASRRQLRAVRRPLIHQESKRRQSS